MIPNLSNPNQNSTPEAETEFLLDAFWDANQSQIFQNLSQTYQDAYGYNKALLAELIEDGDLDRDLEKEKNFVRAVINKFAKWSIENEPICLWDVDETIGTNLATKYWHPRASALSLFEFLHKEFPNVENGFLSNRELKAMHEQLMNGGELNPFSKFINPQHIYSSRGFCDVISPDGSYGNSTPQQIAHELYRNDQVKMAKFQKVTFLEETFLEKTGRFTTRSSYDKYLVLEELKSSNHNVKLIDDDPIAKYVEPSGLHLDSNMIATK